MSTIFLTLDASDRLQLSTTIERLINLLDDIDGDPDFEPWIGGDLAGGTAHDDREADGLDGLDSDGEPWLGWTSTGAYGHRSNADLECDEGGAS